MTVGSKRNALVVVLNNTLEHHITLVYRTIFLGETLSIVDETEGWASIGRDTLLDAMTLTDFLELFQAEPDCLLVCADVHHAPLAKYLARVSKSVSPRTQVMAFGRATTFIPQFFKREPFDAVHVSGDREVAIRDFLRSIDGGPPPRGAYMVNTGKESAGVWGKASEWAFPKLSALPLKEYRDYVMRAYGPHYTPRISATIGKGCTWGCEYCGATQEEGSIDRRRPPAEVVEWGESVTALRDGFSFHLYHPNLFHNPSWVRAFCAEYGAKGASFDWRGVTTVVSLRDEDLVKAAGENGCRELAVGVESVSATNFRPAKSSLRALESAASACAKARISLKGLVMAGYPGQRDEDLEHTVATLTSLGLMVRFTGYTPLHELRGLDPLELDSLSLERFDRRTYRDPQSQLSTRSLYLHLTQGGGYAFPDFES